MYLFDNDPMLIGANYRDLIYPIYYSNTIALIKMNENGFAFETGPDYLTEYIGNGMIRTTYDNGTVVEEPGVVQNPDGDLNWLTQRTVVRRIGRRQTRVEHATQYHVRNEQNRHQNTGDDAGDQQLRDRLFRQ